MRRVFWDCSISMSTAKLLEVLRGSGDAAMRQAHIDRSASERDSVNLIGCDLTDCDLSGLFLVHVSMTNVDLRRSRCSGTSFGPLSDCLLDEVVGTGTRFCRMERCRMHRGSLDGPRIGARISECDFSESSLRCGILGIFGQKEEGIDSHFYSNSFARTKLFGFDAAGAFLAGSRFEGAQLDCARLSRSDLAGCTFDSARASNSNLAGAMGEGSTFLDADIQNCFVTPELAAIIRETKPVAAHGLSVQSPWIDARASELQELLWRAREYRISWECTHPVLNQRHKIYLSKDEGDLARPSIGVFQCETRECIRFYWGEPVPLAELLALVSDDYLGWVLDATSLRVVIAATENNVHINETLRGMLADMHGR
jgi:uncharacterized protein YjbI with pentapeptide repeats